MRDDVLYNFVDVLSKQLASLEAEVKGMKRKLNHLDIFAKQEIGKMWDTIHNATGKQQRR